jgi:hypothetical protein
VTEALAWPYAVARGRLSGYQAIVVPGFLASAGLSYLVEYATHGEEVLEPDCATIREVIGAPIQPLSLVYRVLTARGDRYGLGSADPLRDSSGRDIPVFEGFVLRLPAERVAALNISVEDLDKVTTLSTGAFRRLWDAPDGIDAEDSSQLAVGQPTAGIRPLNMHIAEPYTVPRRGDTPEAGHDAGRTRTRPRTRAGVRPARGPARGPAQPRPQRRRPDRVRNFALVIVAVLVGLIAWLLWPSPGPAAQTAVDQLCTNLQDGQLSAAYQQFSSGFQRSTSLAAFQAQLLGPSTGATCSPGKPAALTSTSDLALITLRSPSGTITKVQLMMESEAGRWIMTGMTVRQNAS